MQEDGRGSDPGLNVKLLVGRLSCAVGVLCGVAEVWVAFLDAGANITAGTLGVGLGVLGYFLGAKRLAIATVFICVAAILFGLAASQGLVPGIAPSHHALPSILWEKENAS